ncbi:hypothetical protein [Haloechinothrix alba]
MESEVAAHHAAPPAGDHVERARGLAKELLAEVRSAVGCIWMWTSAWS